MEMRIPVQNFYPYKKARSNSNFSKNLITNICHREVRMYEEISGSFFFFYELNLKDDDVNIRHVRLESFLLFEKK